MGFPFKFKSIDSQSDIEAVRNYLDKNNHAWGEVNKDNYWQGRTLFYHDIKDDSVQNIMIDVLKRGIGAIKQNNNSDREVYCEHLSMARWPVGYDLRPHADGEEPDGRQHQFHWRDYAFVTFLNKDFEGGTLYFPNQAIEIDPEPGYSVCFPGTLEYLHGVTEITKGVRYTIASFLTHNETYNLIKL